MIDAGHGGKDPGAVGKKGKEKDVTLAIAKKTGEYIKKNHPDVKVIYTRKSDVAVSLNERASIANKNNADVFISIHCNSVSKSPNTAGVETFIMGDHRNAANLNVAMMENASILYENDADENYDGFNPNSTEAYIMFSYIQSNYKAQSFCLAELIQNELKKKRHDRGVQQAGFLVLYKTTMPSVLVEVGFMSNPKEEEFLLSENGQNYLASAIASAFRSYKNSVEQEAESLAKKERESDNAVDTENGTVYKVQFATRNRKLENPETVYTNLKDVGCYEHNGMFKYTAGRFSSKEDAKKYQKEVVAKGYEGAFVVAFENGKRIE
ncbi:MAG: N-acetylmuramoyl-L-alanine amidase [Candidatus Limimorpha sp.]